MAYSAEKVQRIKNAVQENLAFSMEQGALNESAAKYIEGIIFQKLDAGFGVMTITATLLGENVSAEVERLSQRPKKFVEEILQKIINVISSMII